MIIITPPEYHGRQCNVCGEKDACCEINFRNDHNGHGIVVALCRDCASVLSYLTDGYKSDVAPVRHGHWIPHDDELGLTMECSACHVESVIHGDYCPACGARMDEEV